MLLYDVIPSLAYPSTNCGSTAKGLSQGAEKADLAVLRRLGVPLNVRQISTLFFGPFK